MEIDVTLLRRLEAATAAASMVTGCTGSLERDGRNGCGGGGGKEEEGWRMEEGGDFA